MQVGVTYTIPVSAFVARARDLGLEDVVQQYGAARGVVDPATGSVTPVFVLTLQDSGRLLFVYGEGSTTNFPGSSSIAARLVQVADSISNQPSALALPGGLSTGVKLAIGIGTVALLFGFAFWIANHEFPSQRRAR